MSDDVYTLAIERARKLRVELQRLDIFISTYEELASTPSKLRSESPEQGTPNPENTNADDDAPFVTRKRGVPQDELERVATRILLENGSPLQRQALFQKVKATGTNIGGRDEMGNFGSKISRSDKFVNLPKLGYWPIDKPCEIVGYQPGEPQ